jgi:hypothetical protein
MKKKTFLKNLYGKVFCHNNYVCKNKKLCGAFRSYYVYFVANDAIRDFIILID